MRFVVDATSGGHAIDVPVRRLLIDGYTGRDQAAVQAHVDELRAHGIAAPKRVPSLFAGIPARLTTGSAITVTGELTSGEAEFIITRHEGELLIGVGSDHTDRDLEAQSIVKAKNVCDKPVAAGLWPAIELIDHWDELILRATAWRGDEEVAYQSGALARMLPLDALVADVEDRVGAIDGDVLFSGTFALLTDGFVYGPRFRAELLDPVLDRTLTCEYTVDALPILDD